MTLKETQVKVSEAMELLGCSTKRALAEALDLKPSAVGNWGDEVPYLRKLQVYDILQKRISEVRK